MSFLGLREQCAKDSNDIHLDVSFFWAGCVEFNSHMSLPSLEGCSIIVEKELRRAKASNTKRANAKNDKNSSQSKGFSCKRDRPPPRRGCGRSGLISGAHVQLVLLKYAQIAAFQHADAAPRPEKDL
eukprot:3904071-Amphidinium_carterae.3